MSKYKRLTTKCEVGIGLTEISGNIVNDYEKVVNRLADLEDKIESGELGDVSEYKHRAEVAERAVREFAVQVGCKSCPFYCRCGIDSPNAKNDYQECYEAILRQAEKELQEKKKE